MKKFLNTCIDCKTVTNKGIWEVTIKKGPISSTETFDVAEEFGPNPEHFDLDVIDGHALSKKYGIKLEEAEKMILEGVVLCPFCKSANFFEYNEKMDIDSEMKLL